MKQIPHNVMFDYRQNKSLVIKYLQIEPTNICNSDCKFCIRREKKQSSKNMSTEELETITAFFVKVEFIKLQGLGECFFNPDLHLLLAHLKEVYPGVVIMSSTNLNCPRTGKGLSAVLENLDILYLSIDGGTKRTYELIRRGCRWETMLDTLGLLAEVKKQHNIFVVSFTASDLNYTEIGGLVELLRDYPIDELRINPVQDWSSDNRLTSSENYTNPEYIQQLRYWHRLGLSEGMSITVVGNAMFDYNRCIWPFERMYIDVYGNVFVCVISLDDKWRQGNIFREGPETIYKNTTMTAIRKCLKENISHSHCDTCSYKLLVPTLNRVKGT